MLTVYMKYLKMYFHFSETALNPKRSKGNTEPISNRKEGDCIKF